MAYQARAAVANHVHCAAVKVIIQIPCWNEERSLPVTFAALPRTIPGVDVVETLVIDDGSTDRTVEVARSLGIDHVVRLVTHQGLARAFERGLLECLRRGADVVVNTDADNQYAADDIPRLVAPILSGEADYVIGDRSVEDLPHFSWIKKKLQRVGSAVVRMASRTDIPDTTSGFRALSRRAVLQLSVHSGYTYTHETLIQAGRKDIPVASVKVGVNPVLRPSRLFRSIPRYVLRSASTIFRIYLIYDGFRAFALLALLSALLGAGALGLWLAAPAVLPAALLLALPWVAGAGALLAVQLFLFALLADLLAVTRRLQEESLTHLRELALREAGALPAPPPGEPAA
ncbi:MAG: glycosyltransferase family 2 protein [Planctomycetes bacterium]|nr:glycosyltransferase family 2 protein [Planctomycetota bacterium]